MKNSNISILESKLKRHKISYSNEYGKIIIGKPQTDYTDLIGLIAFPIIAAIVICVFLILNDFENFSTSRGKILVGIILLFGIGLFNFLKYK